MDGINLIQDLAIVLLGAGLAGAICRRIGLSVVVGYLLAGMVIGPYTPPFSLVNDVARIETLSQVGLVFLMFAIGLGLSLTRLKKMGLFTLLATGLGAFFVLNLTQLLGHLAGWSSAQSLFVAAMLMVSSSAIIARVIKELNLGHERFAQVALTITVLEDVVAVVMLAILGSKPGAAGIGSLLTGLGAFVVFLVITGLILVPRLLRRLEARADPELQTIVIAGVLFLTSMLAVRAGYSLALGAFLFGAIVAEMRQKGGVEKAFAGMRDTFSSVFFVSIGMMIDVTLMVDVWPWILGLTLFALAARPLSTGLALILLGTPPQEARRAGLLLTPLGEFTFVIVQLGVGSQVLAPEFYPITVGAAILTILLTPVINRRADGILRVIEKGEPSWVSRSLEAYHQWLAQLGSVGGGRLWWRLSKKRLIHIALEVLLVTGLLTFSGQLLAAFQRSLLAQVLTPAVLQITFWSGIALLASMPLVAIWRNITAVAMIFAEVAGNRSRFLAPIVVNGFKAFGALGIAYWFFRVLPTASLSRWIWLAIAAVPAAVAVIFSRRLIYWHSEWENSLRDVFAESPAGGNRRHWLETPGDWEINVQELILPEDAACSGKSIAEVDVRSRFGCSIVEIDRQGHTIIAPRPTHGLYSGDRLLLLGTRSQIAAAREELSQVKSVERGTDFDTVRLETVTVPPGPHAGATLAELQIPRRLGVLVAGIGRTGARIVNPAGEERLLEGDELLVLGAPEQIRNFRGWIAQAEGA